MKAYKDDQGNVRLFRPYENARRLNRSAHRLRLPTMNEDGFVKLLEKLVLVDKDWIPTGKGYSMYIRPTLISTQSTLGVGAATTALFFVIMSPVGPYYPTGFKPVRLVADSVNVRVAPGGTGAFKLGAYVFFTSYLQSAHIRFTETMLLLLCHKQRQLPRAFLRFCGLLVIKSLKWVP